MATGGEDEGDEVLRKRGGEERGGGERGRELGRKRREMPLKSIKPIGPPGSYSPPLRGA